MDEPTLSDATEPADQLEAIHAMLAAGNCAIRVEPHTFVLWGLVGAFWVLAEGWYFTAARFPIYWQRGVAQKVVFGVAVAATAVADVLITKRARRQRDESYPFIQRQIGKLALLLFGLGLASGVTAWFLEEKSEIFVFWLVLIGLILYSHGLFSGRFLEWAGLSLMALAAAAVVLRVPFEGTRCLLAAASGVGLPLVGLLTTPLSRRPLITRLGALCVWTAAVAFAGYALYYVSQ